jgi:stage V sporulation protein D (sporulation-specific penicillin-binding protein)
MRRVLTKEMVQQKEEAARLWAILILLGMCLLFLAWRLVHLQIVSADELQKKATDLRRKSVPLHAQRGTIRDREGQVLVSSEWVAYVVINPERVGDVPFASAWLAKHLKQDPQTLQKTIEQAKQRGSKYLRIARNVPWERAERLRTAYKEEIRASEKQGNTSQAGPDFEGRVGLVWLEKTMVREYPNGSLAAHVLGLIQVEETKEGLLQVQPKGGIEKTQHRLLAGTDGVVAGEVDGRGWIIPETRVKQVDPQDGRDLQITLDATIQAAAENALRKLQNAHHPKSSIAIVLDPRTGEILALASFPTYNPGNRKTLHNRADALINRAISYSFEPGSIFKPLTIAWALQQRSISPNTHFSCSGAIKVGKKTIRCAHGHMHGNQNLEKILSLSCNVAMAQLGLKMGGKELYACTKQFGLLSRTGIELPYESTGWLDEPDTWQAPQLRAANVAFGQGVSATPLGIASAYAALANDGVWVQPHLIKGEQQRPLHRVVSPEIARLVRMWLVDTTIKGTGKAARIKGYTLAGKTGTAQKADPKRGYLSGKYLSSFVGFVPAQNPRAVVLVMVDEPRNGHYGGDVAAPVFREIAEYLVWRWRVERE